jgi:group I intron endonuclease
MYSIYLITNKVNGKKYVGQTKYKVNRRWIAHKNYAKNGVENKFYNAIRKYGALSFEVVTIETLEDRKEANASEERWIKILDTTNPDFGYNTKKGGEGFELPEETKQKISNSHKQRFIDNPELRTDRSKINKERVFSEEARLNMRLAKLGKSRGPFSEEHKQKIAESNKKSWENRERDLGPRPEEVKTKITDGLKAYHASLTEEEKQLRSQRAREKALAYYANKKDSNG